MIIFKVLVCGGRKFDNERLIYRELDEYHERTSISHLIQGGAPGVDTIARDWARSRGVQPVTCEALWDYYRQHGSSKAAGPIRNRAMLLLSPDIVLAFPGGAGTSNMVQIALKAKLKVYRVRNERE